MTDDRWCRHGTYIGDPYGPDYMCHYCEMGYSDEDYEAEMLWRLKRGILGMLFRQNQNLRISCDMLRVMRESDIDPDPALIARIEGYARRTY